MLLKLQWVQTFSNWPELLIEFTFLKFREWKFNSFGFSIVFCPIHYDLIYEFQS